MSAQPSPENSRRSEAELNALAYEGAAALADASTSEILDWVARTFPGTAAVASSMADGVLPHLASRRIPGIDVLFADTGYHFDETTATRDTLSRAVPVTLRSIRPTQTVEEQDAAYGPDLYARDPDLCCRLRKVEPLRAALADYEVWLTGLRRADSASRRDAPVVAYDHRNGLVKVNPIVAWSDEEVQAYIDEHDVVVNPLLAQGYPSIGCAPCTRAVGVTGDSRAGRWVGTEKTECGLHI